VLTVVNFDPGVRGRAGRLKGGTKGTQLENALPASPEFGFALARQCFGCGWERSGAAVLDDAVPVRIDPTASQYHPIISRITNIYVGLCLTRKDNRNFRNVSAYARHQIGSWIEGRFVKKGVRRSGILDSSHLSHKRFNTLAKRKDLLVFRNRARNGPAANHCWQRRKP
jgi:hypothetical protein